MAKRTGWTKEEIKHKLETNQEWLEKAIIAIYDRQTQDEKDSGQTIKHNKVGFSGAHASSCTYYAHWILGGRHLSGRHLVKARKFMVHYAGQLAKIANGEI